MDTFCVLPFIHLNIQPNGQATVCCVSTIPLLDNEGKPYNIRTHRLEEIWNSPAMAAVRQQLLNAEQPPQCAGCYEAECRGKESRRQIENHMFLHEESFAVSQKGIGAYCAERENIGEMRTSRENVAQYAGKPWNFDLRFDNICNLKCVICGGHSSSRIESDSIHMAWTGEQPIVREPNRFGDAEMWIKSDALLAELIEFGSEVRYLQLAGGEPFLSKLALSWMACLAQSGRAKDVTLRIFSNLQTFSEEIIDLLSNFRKIHIILSIDGTEDTYEYVRYPGKWHTIERHAAMLASALRGKLQQTDVTINVTMSAQSAIRVTDVFDFGKAHGFGVMLNCAYGPAHASPRYLPNTTKDRVEAMLLDYSRQNPHFKLLPQQIGQVVSVMRSVDITDPQHSDAVENLMRFTNDMDASRGLSFAKIQPQVVDDFQLEFGRWVTERRFSSLPDRDFLNQAK